MSNPLVSICIPTYSRLQYLQESVQSALNQTYSNIEICISQDYTPIGLNKKIEEWCKDQIKNDSRIRYQPQSKNLGLAGNWNQLVTMAQGVYIIIIGDDDLLGKDFTERLVRFGMANNADVVFSEQYFIDENGKILEKFSTDMAITYKRESLQTGVLENPVLNVFNNSIPMSGSIIKKQWLTKYKFDERVNTPEFEVFLKIAIDKGIFFFLKDKLAFYRVHVLSATSTGLTIDRLLNNVIDIAVEQKHEQKKHEFIASKIIPAVNRALRQDNKPLAKKLLYSKYYPHKKIEKYVQLVFLNLPNWLIKKII